MSKTISAPHSYDMSRILPSKLDPALTAPAAVITVADNANHGLWEAHMKRLTRRLLFLSASLWLLSVMFPLVSPAWADINGNCGATFKGVDIKGRGASSAGDAIDVDNDEVVNVNMTSTGGFTSHKVELEIAGVSRTISNKTDAGDTQWSDTVNVKDYAWMGSGLYTVTL